jgi:hypothetical protein
VSVGASVCLYIENYIEQSCLFSTQLPSHQLTEWGQTCNKYKTWRVFTYSSINIMTHVLNLLNNKIVKLLFSGSVLQEDVVYFEASLIHITETDIVDNVYITMGNHNQ